MSEEETFPIDEEVGIGQVDMEQAKAFEDEAVRIVEAGKQQGVTLRVIGALAFHSHCPEFGYIQAKLNRVYTDIDFAGYGKQNAQIRKLFLSIGYDEDVEINAFHAEGGRLIFNHPGTHLHIDVFMDKLDFCHPIYWKNRLEVDDPTIPLAELLLEKMQIVKINEKDIIDTIMLLREHQVAPSDDDCINSAQVAKLCAAEWGLWRTTTMNLDKVRDYLPHLDLIGGGQEHRRRPCGRTAHGHGRPPQGHQVEAARQDRRQGQVVQRRSTERRRTRRMAFWKKKDSDESQPPAAVLRHGRARL